MLKPLALSGCVGVTLAADVIGLTLSTAVDLENMIEGASMKGPRSSYQAGKSKAAIAAVALVALCASASFSAAQNRLSVGTLTCRANAGTGPTVNLRQRMRCHFVSSWGRLRGYSGIVTEFATGPDRSRGNVMRWSVLMKSRPTSRRFLTGRYIAASKTGEIGPGVDGKDLVGGADRSIVLRPSSSSRGRSAMNLAPEVAALAIDYGRGPRKREI